jgi:hypothetical protein
MHPFLHTQVFGGNIVHPLTRKWGVGHVVSKVPADAAIGRGSLTEQKYPSERHAIKPNGSRAS